MLRQQKQEERLQSFLEERVLRFNQPAFIDRDPVAIPHAFAAGPDREIAGLFAALFAWGNRTTILAKSRELMARMDHRPYQFIVHHSDQDLKGLLGFKHRTFTDTDLLYLVEFLHRHFTGTHPRTPAGMDCSTLETAFSTWMDPGDKDMEKALAGFYHYFCSAAEMPGRTRKHVATPERKSTCKRLNMYLRWMVRRDDRGVDFGDWQRISPAQLICPVDLHVARVARRFGLLQRQQTDWLAALELTAALRRYDPADPVKFDFALFGMGIDEKY